MGFGMVCIGVIVVVIVWGVICCGVIVVVVIGVFWLVFIWGWVVMICIWVGVGVVGLVLCMVLLNFFFRFWVLCWNLCRFVLRFLLSLGSLCGLNISRVMSRMIRILGVLRLGMGVFLGNCVGGGLIVFSVVLLD